jgi:hypothetical protein
MKTFPTFKETYYEKAVTKKDLRGIDHEGKEVVVPSGTKILITRADKNPIDYYFSIQAQVIGDLVNLSMKYDSLEEVHEDLFVSIESEI